MISFVVMMVPVPKGRPRFWRGRVLTDRKTRAFEKEFQKLAMAHRPPKPLDGPIELTVLFQLKRPKTVKREQPTCKPDADNLTKAIMDSCNGMFWLDDSQIVRIYARKRYGLTPLIKVEISRPGESSFEKADAIAEGIL